ncbi:Hsp33 family molecular chaperone HslO [Escherichia coli]
MTNYIAICLKNFAVRGELVTVSETLQQIPENHDYPQPVKKTCWQNCWLRPALLTATLKFDGDITVQLQGDGPMNLAVINGNNNQQMRGVARVQGEIPEKCRPENAGRQWLRGDHHYPERRRTLSGRSWSGR